MTVLKLLEDLSKRESLPVEVSDVLAEIRNRGIDDIVEFFYDIELDTQIIAGFLKRDEFEKDGKKRFKSVITYGKMGHEQERLVCCKELLHILDPDGVRVESLQQLESLINKMSLPANLVDPVPDRFSSTDRIAILEAIAILFPLGARNILYEKYVAGKISLAWVAEQAELPYQYAKMVMNGYWPDMHKIIIDRRRIMDQGPAGNVNIARRAARKISPKKGVRG